MRIAGALSVKLPNLEQSSRRQQAGKQYGSLRSRPARPRTATRLNRTAHSQARTMFERAIALDPRKMPAAYVGLGRIDLSAARSAGRRTPEAALKRAEDWHARRSRSTSSIRPPMSCSDEPTHAGGVRARGRGAQPRRRAQSQRTRQLCRTWRCVAVERRCREGAIKFSRDRDRASTRASRRKICSALARPTSSPGRTADAMRVSSSALPPRKEGNPFIYAMLAATYAEGGRDAGFTISRRRSPQAQSVLRCGSLRFLVQEDGAPRQAARMR